ncbi:hypothetical protein FHETE_5744 [Fusarium heterosporum]|uniref:Uncharacterized protein n=1 Tax=Fusarium heterosporum TaxID=42747 RepID=A0A8H5TC02_FUSHE|nr:hypothetical protein FHETE_5744 [Fusarium heterosporum]
MGQQASLIVETEIEAPVEVVKSLFKDFHRFKEWSSWSIDPAVHSKKMDDLIPKDKLSVDVKDLKFTATLLKNDLEAFEWSGGIWPLLTGEHEFSWRPSTTTQGGTTFRQRENWRGLVASLWRPGRIMGKKTRKNFESFNAEVKEEAERRAAA